MLPKVEGYHRTESIFYRYISLILEFEKLGETNTLSATTARQPIAWQDHGCELNSAVDAKCCKRPNRLKRTNFFYNFFQSVHADAKPGYDNVRYYAI